MTDIDFETHLQGDTLENEQQSALPAFLAKGTVLTLTEGEEVNLAVLKEDVFQDQDAVSKQMFILDSESFTASSHSTKTVACMLLGQTLD